ncbi:LysR family transcriptional regulator [Bradyrhizobium sp. NP1]|uniref:LysR family transcriptional regulator n=1 Tax=Bradyrhizobium sp. NP1 TaxID=3049772 RepID=UPI0025A65F1E|nr:LysR family transcriptional regulator [Bradyrhizobium sp. NP1]WJR78673.1 LysR family transcriptional regulator [Bradyrhizobium sp. NP1]
MLSEMRAFVAFTDAGTVQATAARLNLTQSAVTRQLQRLEQQLGTALLDRRTKPPAITPAGRALLQRCRAILRDVADLKAGLAPDHPPSGNFRIGVGYVLADDEIAACVHGIGQDFPNVSISLRTDWHPALIEMVRQGGLDIAVIPTRPDLPLPVEVRGAIVGREPLVFVAAKGSAIGGRPTLAALARLPWIVKPKGTGTREVLDAALQRESLALGEHSEVRDENLQLSLVARGLGLALATRRSVARHPRNKALRSLSLRGHQMHLDVVMIRSHPLGRLEPVADAFASALRARFAARRR